MRAAIVTESPLTNRRFIPCASCVGLAIFARPTTLSKGSLALASCAVMGPFLHAADISAKFRHSCREPCEDLTEIACA